MESFTLIRFVFQDHISEDIGRMPGSGIRDQESGIWDQESRIWDLGVDTYRNAVRNCCKTNELFHECVRWKLTGESNCNL